MLKKLWNKWFKKYPPIITRVYPDNKSYKIRVYGLFGFYKCYPKTEADYLELLLVYDGFEEPKIFSPGLVSLC